MHKKKGDVVMTPACYSTMQPPQECHVVAHHWLAHPAERARSGAHGGAGRRGGSRVAGPLTRS
jgi:hypothetical protein